MDVIEEFHLRLKESIEAHSDLLKKGELFLPMYLKGKEFVGKFKNVAGEVSRTMEYRLQSEVTNRFPSAYESNPQRVDYVFSAENGKPTLFLELESLDRAQMYLFHSGPINENNNDNKLWYYHGTLSNHFSEGALKPRYFIFFLVLPDRKVEPYHLWDMDRDYQLYDDSLKRLVYENPYRFYDRQIKAAARAFLRDQCDLFDGRTWINYPREKMQELCELVFVTCTIDQLVLSRGKDLFHPEKERSLALDW